MVPGRGLPNGYDSSARAGSQDQQDGSLPGNWDGLNLRAGDSPALACVIWGGLAISQFCE